MIDTGVIVLVLSAAAAAFALGALAGGYMIHRAYAWARPPKQEDW